MERGRYFRREGGADRWLRLLRDVGIALVGVAALAGLARDLSATRGPVVAWIIVTLLGGAAGLFAWSLLEVRDASGRWPSPHPPDAPRVPHTRADRFSAGADEPQPTVPLMPLMPLVPPGLFPPTRRPALPARRTQRRTTTRGATREQRMRTRRTPAVCAGARSPRPIASASRRRPPTTA